MRRITIAIIAIITSLQPIIAHDNPRLMIFRNDSVFNVINLSDNFSITHNAVDGRKYIDIQGENVPLEVVDSCVIRNTDIPTLRISLPQYPEAGTVWNKDDYIDAGIIVEGNGMTEDADFQDLTVKGRGNSTWWLPKKPIRLKFEKKHSLCGLKKGKSYVLLANYLDRSHMCNAISLWLANRLGIPYSNHFMPCNVVFNDNELGLYLLTEKIGFNAGSIDDIDEKEGILFELSTEFDEKYKFKTKRFALPTMVKDPDFDELYINDSTILPEERLAIWEKDFNRAVIASNFEEFDLETFVNYQLVVSFARNGEVGYPKSVYLYKADLQEGTKYKFGPVWDFDIAYNFRTPTGNGYKTTSPDTETWQNLLFRNLKILPEFQAAYKARFEEFDREILPELLEFADNYSKIIEPSCRLDGQRWPESVMGSWYYRVSSFYNNEIYQELRQWILDRVDAMRERLPDVL